MAERKSFIMYADTKSQLDLLTDMQLGALMRGVYAYVADGTPLETADGMVALMFSVISAQIDRDTEKYEDTCKKRSAAGKKGNQKRWQKSQMPSKQSQTIANIADSDSDSDSESDNESENVSDSGSDSEACARFGKTQTCAPPALETTTTPPSVETVESYCCEHGYAIDAQHFVDYYAAKGWMLGRSPMRDWQAVVRNWARNQSPQNAPPDTGEHSYNLADFEQLMNQF